MAYENIITRKENGVGLVQFNRPHALNALNFDMIKETADAFSAFDSDDEIGCLVLSGSDKAFAAGADIKDMATATPVAMLGNKMDAHLERMTQLRKPLIAAVSGYALGGGCEVAMMCDMIVCSESAKFGQPEINLGIIPGWGGTQRLTRAVGKSLAMEMVLNGRYLSATEAVQYGLANYVYPQETYLEDAMIVASQIAARAPIALQLGKDAVNTAFELSLKEGLTYEKRLFNMMFATEDQKEGMDAFVNKRKANWKGK